MTDKASISQRLAGLPQEKRALLRKLLLMKSKAPQPREPQERVPLTYGQQRLWVVDQLSGKNPAYNECNYIRFPFALDVDLFRRAVNLTIERHESLRTVIEVSDGEPYQTIKPSVVLDIPLVDLRRLPHDAREAEALRLASEEARVPVDLAQGPLLRASIFRLDDNEFLFALMIHHIICDGWSIGVLAVELSALYWSLLAGEPSPLPPLKIQYPDFALWQQRSLNDERLAPQLDYWRTQLANLPTLDLPADHPRPAQFTFRGARHPIAVPSKLFRSLTQSCESDQVTPQILFLTVFLVLLSRYSGQEDIAVIAPVAGRNSKELEPLIGFFVNSLVIRADLSGDPTFVDLLARVRESSFSAYRNQDVPFERLILELDPARDQSRNPLAQVAFQIFQPPSVPNLDPNLVFGLSPIDTGYSKFDLMIQIILAKNELKGHIEYCSDLYDAERIERLIQHFYQLIESVATDRAQPISRLNMLSQSERSEQIERNATQADYPRDSNIAAVFRRQAVARAHHIAIRFGRASLTYREVNDQSDWIAARLLTLGVQPGKSVGLLMDRSLEFPVASLGIAKAGAIGVPLDPSYPHERLSYLISDSGADVIITNAEFLDLAKTLTKETLIVEDVIESGGSAALPDIKIAANDIACLMYTSGTTGTPKGVAITHRNILRLVKGIGYVDINRDEVMAQIGPTNFDASLFEIWGSLLNGATLVVYPPLISSLNELGEFIRTSGITLLFITTALFRQMIDGDMNLRYVRQLITGGEVMPTALARAAFKSLPRTRLFNAYGPTECTTFSSIFPMTNMEDFGDNVPIGKPIENTTMFILDRHGNPAPVGVPGEIYIGGDGVASGYWNNPEATDRSFVPDTFTPGGRLYRTGDWGEYRADGNILFLGRSDRQIKLSGYRIELAEVEAAIAKHDDVTGVAVVKTGIEDQRLSAFVELLPGRELTYARLREFLSTLLPTYMIPAHLTVMDKLPLTPNGKVDYAKLSLEPGTVVSMTDEYLSPRNPAELVLVRLWEEVLGVKRIGVTDNFFNLGGQSLVATRLLSRTREAFRTEITMRQFFDNPTIAGLASIVASEDWQFDRDESVVGAAVEHGEQAESTTQYADR